MLLAFAWSFLTDPTLVAPTRDPAWYTWRANLLLHADPSKIVQDWGPFGMFSGGYRVTTPMLGALLMRVGGLSRYTFSIFFMVGAPVLASLALGAFAYRHRRDPLLFLLTFFAGGALFLTTPYVGYMDNIMCLYILALTLPFLEPARTSWGARSAVFLFMLLAALTHPTTLALFVLVLIASAGLHFLTSRFSFKKTLDRDGPMLISAALGVVVGLAVWKVGAWGVKAPFADAALPPPYSTDVFKATSWEWVKSLKPVVTFPLIAIALVWVAATVRGERRPTDEYRRLSVLWLAPLAGLFGWVIGLTYPYYRFMNTTLALSLLVGLGAWVAARYLLQPRLQPAGVGGVAVILTGLGFIFSSGLGPWSSTEPPARWIDKPTRAAMAAVNAYIDAESSGRPIAFVVNYRHDRRAWGWAKTYANSSRAGLTGDKVLRSVVYFGALEDYLAGRPTGVSAAGCEHRMGPGRGEGQADYVDVYKRVSCGFFLNMRTRLANLGGGKPSAFLIGRYNQGTDNETVLDPTQRIASVGTLLGPDVTVLTAPRLAPTSQSGVDAGRDAWRAESAALADPAGRLADPLHLLRVLLVVGLILLVPGLLAMRWFELESFPVRFALVPGISLGLVMLSGVAVVALHRAPFGMLDGVATIALAIAIGAGLHGLARRREAGKAVVVPFVRRSLSLFDNRNFAYLMGAVFLSVMGDGIVQGALAKTIAFGKHKGFDITNARSSREILGIVLLTYLPYSFVSPVMGVLIDRFDRRVLLVLANGFRAGAIFVLGLAMAVRLPDAALIGALLLTLASTRLVLAIKSASIPVVLGGRRLMQGNSIAQAGSAVSQLLGAGIAFVGTAATSAGAVVVAGAVVYGVGAVLGSRVRNLSTERGVTRFMEGVRRLLRDIWEGLKQVRKRAAARLGLTSFLGLRVLVSYTALVFALEIRAILGGSSSKKGIVIAGLAAVLGAGIGFVIAEQLKDRLRPERLVISALVLAGAGVVAFGGVVSVLGLSVVAFVTAFAYFVGKISADTLMQRALPDRYRGRGFSLFDIAYNLAWIVPALVLWAAWQDDRARLLLIGAGVVFLGVATAVAAWARALNPEIRRELAEQGTGGQPAGS
jgi:hypothetical protein